MAYGLTSHSPVSADAARVLQFNQKHWDVESHHYILNWNWNWNEDRCTINAGNDPENMTCLRQFAMGLIRAINKKDSISSVIEKLARIVRQVFDYLRMTTNSRKII